MIERWTLKESVVLEGRGLHSGLPVILKIHPGSSGVWFRWGATRLEAIPENVTETRRCTRLGEISTIEHLMSALAGCGITDAEVELSYPELPALDGSALPYVEAISASGLERIGETPLPELFTRIFLQEEDIKIAISKGSGHWSYLYDTGSRWPGVMRFDAEPVSVVYPAQVAPARTFAFAEEVESARASGLGLGLDEASALILGPRGYVNEARFESEPARHKLLDLIGDLYLAGMPVGHLNVSAERSGHSANLRAASMLRQAILRP